jgi:hypothetical protein
MAKSQKQVVVAVAAAFVMPTDASHAFVAGTVLAVAVKASDESIKAEFGALDTPEKKLEFRKANAGKKRGRKEKADAGVAVQMSGKDALVVLHAGMAHTAKAQETFAGNAQFLAWLGEHVAVLNGTKKPE